MIRGQSNRTTKKRNKRALERSWPIGALREDAQDARNEGPGAAQGWLSAFAKREITHPSGFCGFVVGKQVRAAQSNEADAMLNTTGLRAPGRSVPRRKSSTPPDAPGDSCNLPVRAEVAPRGLINYLITYAHVWPANFGAVMGPRHGLINPQVGRGWRPNTPLKVAKRLIQNPST